MLDGTDLDRLDATTEDPADLFEHFERRAGAGRTYRALPQARHGVERGTVVFDDGVVVRGYPSIPRVLVLEPGVPSYFDDATSVAVEEKLNGSNLRIAEVRDPLAFTRSGYVCPYSTARVRELFDLDGFFDDHPETMLCAEFVGPETPYTSHDYDDVDSDAVRVFDVRDRESGEPLPVTERRDLCAAYDFDQPRLLGYCDPDDAVEAVSAAIEKLDAEGREGVVLKTEDGTAMLKYTTGSQHRDELAYGFSLPFDRGQDFLFSRVVREGFQAAELEDDEEKLRERAHDLGESILLPMVETIRDVADGETVGECQTVRGPPGPIEAFLDHLRAQSLTIAVERDEFEDGERVVEFVKVAESTEGRIRHYLEGGVVDE